MGIKVKILWALGVTCLAREMMLTMTEPTLINPSIDASWYTGQGCEVNISEADFVFLCGQSGIFSVPISLPFDESTESLLKYNPFHVQGISGRIEQVFPGSSTGKLLLLAKEASQDISAQWIIFELSTNSEADDETQNVLIKPAFVLPGDYKPEWLRMAQDRTWLALVRNSDQHLVLMEADMDAEDYKTAAGIENGKFEKIVGHVGNNSRDFD